MLSLQSPPGVRVLAFRGWVLFAFLHEAAKKTEGVFLGDVCEETGVYFFNRGDRPGSERRSALGHPDAPCASVSGVDLAVDQALPLEGAEDLRGHLDVRARLRGDRDLVGRIAMLVEPPGAGEQHELNVGKPERRQRLRDAPLPAQSCVPEQEARALVRLERGLFLRHGRAALASVDRASEI